MKYNPSKHEWGTDASVKHAKSLTPGEKKKKKLKDMREKVSPSDLKSVEKKADSDLKPYNISIDLGTRHFSDRVNDKRNDPEIRKDELDSLISKVKKAKGQKIKQRKDGEAVLRDKKTKINMPVAIKTKRDGSGKKITDVTAKTIMRKQDFKTSKSSPTIAYEEKKMKDFHEFRKEVEEAKYQGKQVSLNKPMPGDVKKSKVFVKDGDKVKKVNFGDKNMSIKKDQKGNKASYCARSKGITGGGTDKTKANYWSRKAWDC